MAIGIASPNIIIVLIKFFGVLSANVFDVAYIIILLPLNQLKCEFSMNRNHEDTFHSEVKQPYIYLMRVPLVDRQISKL